MITEQILVVADYQTEREAVVACCDTVEEARQLRLVFKGPLTLYRVRIVEVVETI